MSRAEHVVAHVGSATSSRVSGARGAPWRYRRPNRTATQSRLRSVGCQQPDGCSQSRRAAQIPPLGGAGPRAAPIVRRYRRTSRAGSTLLRDRWSPASVTDRRRPARTPTYSHPAPRSGIGSVTDGAPADTASKLMDAVINFSADRGPEPLVGRSAMGQHSIATLDRRRGPSMALDPNRWTLKTQEAFNAAVELARAPAIPRSRPPTCSLALLGQDGRRRPARSSKGRRVARPPCAPRPRRRSPSCPRPTAASPAWPRRSPACSTPPTASGPSSHDEYLSTEHLLLALADTVGVPREQLLDGAARGAGQPPGHQPEPRGPVPGAREVRPRPHRGRPRPARSIRSSAATTRSAGSSRCCRAARRTTRCSSASPVSARRPSSRAWPGASSRATCPRACATSG